MLRIKEPRLLSLSLRRNTQTLERFIEINHDTIKLIIIKQIILINTKTLHFRTFCDCYCLFIYITHNCQPGIGNRVCTLLVPKTPVHSRHYVSCNKP